MQNIVLALFRFVLFFFLNDEFGPATVITTFFVVKEQQEKRNSLFSYFSGAP